MSAPVGVNFDYTPGRLDHAAPPHIWLQIDTTGDNDDRDGAWPGSEHVTWQDESIGGLEIQYVRADLALAAEGVQPGEVDDTLTLADVAGILGEIAEGFDGGEYAVSDETRRVLIDFASGLADHPLFAIVCHYFAQRPANAALTGERNG